MPLTQQHIQETLCVDCDIDFKFDYGIDGQFRAVVHHGTRGRLLPRRQIWMGMEDGGELRSAWG